MAKWLNCQIKEFSILKALFLLALIGGTAWILIDVNTAPYRHMEGKVFGTYYHITYQSSTDYDQDILSTLNQVDASLSAFNPGSIVSQVNSNKPVAVDPMFSQVFSLAQEVSAATDGAFDITVAPLVNLWGFGFQHGDSVTQARIDSIMPLVGYKKVRESSHSKIEKDDPRIMLDFSAIAKGYGCDQVAALLTKHQVTNYLVEIGGEVCAAGLNPDHKSWTVGIVQPEEGNSQALQAVISSPATLCMATSGNYRNYYVKDGQRYAHTIAPHTGRPVQHTLLSATVLAPSCAMADAYATAFMVMGLDKAKALLSANPSLQAYLIYSNGTDSLSTWHTPALTKYMQ